MPSRTFALALNKTLHRKQRARQACWLEVCARAHNSKTKETEATIIARELAHRIAPLSAHHRELLVRVLVPAIVRKRESCTTAHFA